MSLLRGIGSLALSLLLLAQVQAAPTSRPLVLEHGTQAVWPKLEVMAESLSDLSPQQAQDWFDVHQPLRLSHEQAQVGGLVPQPRWARLVIHNDEPRLRTKVLVFPSTTQD